MVIFPLLLPTRGSRMESLKDARLNNFTKILEIPRLEGVKDRDERQFLDDTLRYILRQDLSFHEPWIHGDIPAPWSTKENDHIEMYVVCCLFLDFVNMLLGRARSLR